MSFRKAQYVLFLILIVAITPTVIWAMHTFSVPWYVAVPASIILVGGGILRFLPDLKDSVEWVQGSFSHDDQFEEPLRQITIPALLKKYFGSTRHVNWIDRQLTDVDMLNRHRRLVIVGEMKVGKTREAVELIRLAVARELVAEDRIYEPMPALIAISADVARSSLKKSFDRQAPMLLFVDDLPKHYRGESLKTLRAVLQGLNQSCTCYVVATARIWHLHENPEAKTWLSQNSFQQVDLRGFNTAEIQGLANNAAGVYELQVDAGAQEALVASNDGTPELLLIQFKRLATKGLTRLTTEAAGVIAHESLVEAWDNARQEAQAHWPLTRFILEALDYFHAAGVRAHTPLVLHFAARRQHDLYHRFWPWPPMKVWRDALARLSYLDFAVTQETVTFSDAAVEDRVASNIARETVTQFLHTHRKWLRNPTLHWLYKDRAAHMWAFFDLATHPEVQGSPETVMDLYTAGLNYNKHFGLFINRGLAYDDLGRYEEALADYDQAIRLNPEDATAFFNRGNTHQKLSQFDEALADYDQAIRLNPEYAKAFINRGNTYQELGRFGEGLVDYDQAIHLNPEDATAFFNRGFTFHNLGRFDEALVNYSQAIHRNPECNVYNNRGNTYQKLGRYEEALADYDQAIRLNPEDATAYNNRGITYQKLGRYEEAIADYDQAIRLNPEDATAYNNRGITYQKLGRYEEAIADYDQAIRLNPEHAIIHNNLAGTYMHLRQFTEAEQHFQESIRLEPNIALSQLVDLGILARHQGQRSDSNTYFHQALATWEQAQQAQLLSLFDLLENKAVALICLGQVTEALAALQEGLAQKLPGDVIEWDHYDLLSEASEPPDGLAEMLALLKAAE